MFTKFFGSADVEPFKAHVSKRVYTPVKLQEIFITAREPQQVIAAIAVE